MQPQTLIFIGRSGCGKGTQAELARKVLEEKDSSHGCLYIQTGDELRHFIKGDSYTQQVTKKIYDTGSLVPDFLTIEMVTKVLIDEYTGNEHIILDGSPRKLPEAQIFDSIFPFYGLPKPWVIHIEVGKEESLRRLLARKRVDDMKEEIEKRLSWFDTEVIKVINYYREHEGYKFIAVSGERSVEEIHADIVKKLGLG